MKDYLSLSSSPCDEPCVQLGSENYEAESLKECARYRDLLVKRFGGIDELDKRGVRFSTKSFPHEYGSYREVVVIFDDEDEDAVEAACHIENNLPQNWDDETVIGFEQVDLLKQEGF